MAARIGVVLVGLTLLAGQPARAQQAASKVSAKVPTPAAFAGHEIGADGELVKYPKVLEYFQLLSKQTDRVKYEQIGTTTLGNPYVLVTISSPENLKRLPRLVEINRK